MVRALSYSLGMMEENTRGLGKMENNMEKENFYILKMVFGKKVFGVREEE
jgi:hypothetical protein